MTALVALALPVQAIVVAEYEGRRRAFHGFGTTQETAEGDAQGKVFEHYGHHHARLVTWLLADGTT